MAKKQKSGVPKRVPTKGQLSKWQRQMKIRRIIIIAAVVFLVGIGSWVGYESYKDHRDTVGPLREVVIEVNGVPFTMEYYVKILDLFTTDMEPVWVYQIADMVADEIIDAELSRQGGANLGLAVTPEEIDARLQEYELPDDKVYRDLISTDLFLEKLREHFDPHLPDEVEQAHVQVMLVESEEVAAEIIPEIEASGNFTALVEEFSHHPQIEGDLGWLPKELMPNTLIADAAFNLTLGEISQPIYDETATKNVGYWLIEVVDVIDEEDDEIKIEARAMLLGSKAEAQRVKAELAGGNPTSLGWLKRGDMGSEAFDEVAFTLARGEISEPVKDESVQTAGGYWLVKVVDRDERELEEEAREQLIDRYLNDWFEEWKESSTIENLLDADKISWAVEEVLRTR